MRRAGLLAAGIALILAGVFLPQGWYDPIPSPENLPRPETSGARLVQLSLLVEGVMLALVGLAGWRHRPLAPDERPKLGGVPAAPEVVSRAAARWWLAGITLLALALRLFRLDSELWLDEVNARLLYRTASPLQILVSYVSSNNHLLYTLLVKLGVALLGEDEWVMRLPAALCGVATVPVMYRTGRLVLSRWGSLAAALLLAVSYHHVFFSQNARGYSAYLLFSLAAAFFLARALEGDRFRLWVYYGGSVVLAFSATLISAFVFAAHLMVGTWAVLAVWWTRGGAPRLLGRLAGVALVTGFLAFQLYAGALPQMLIYMRAVYVDPAAGYAPLSWEFVRALADGLSAGYGAAWLLAAAVPAAAVGALGFVSVLRRNWAFVLALALPGVLLGVFLIVRGLVISPRLFLLMLILGIVCGVRGLERLAESLARRTTGRRATTAAGTAVIVILAAVSLVPLRRYYAVPKQASRTSLVYVESIRRPGDIVLVVHLAAGGFLYYGSALGLRQDETHFLVRTVERLDAVLSSHPGRRALAITTFPRALRLTAPDLLDRIQRGWTPDRTFPATVGDGEVTVWVPRDARAVR